jgi:acyl-CoA synthetase (AMP-forming)/AMP-acid ligase II
MTMWGLVAAAAESHPGRVLFGDNHGRLLTASALRDVAERVAAGLEVQPGEVVSWQLPNGLEAVVMMAALARIGAVQNPVIPILRRRDLDLITAQVSTSTLVVPEVWRGFSYGDMARGLGRSDRMRVIAVDLGGAVTGDIRLPMGDPATLPVSPAGARECRWVYFSSGTTGAPKGARHTDASLIASSSAMTDRLGIREGDVYPIAWPVTHIGGASMTAAVLRAGGRLVLFESFDPATFGTEAAALSPTVLGSGVPFFRACLDAQRRHGAEPLFPALRACTAGGAPTPPELIRELSEALGVSGVVNSWGLTEFPIATCPSPSDRPEQLERSVGPPAPGVEVRVVDGELRLKGPQCFLGYVDPSLDTDVFDEESWFRTGDLGHIDSEGFVTVTGRLKDIIIRNGENIAPSEVEDVILGHPYVTDVAVVGLPDSRTGERVCAVVVPAPDATITLELLRSFCLEQGMPRQKAPEQLETLPVLDRNAMGKVVRADLVARIVPAAKGRPTGAD